MTRSGGGPERGAAVLGTILLLLVAACAAGGGFALQRGLSDAGSASVHLPDDRRPVPVSDCPGGPPVAELHGGDRVFAVGVHADADGWLLIRNPVDPAEHWWIEGDLVSTDAPTTALPEISCDDPVAASILDATDADADQLAATPVTEPDTDDEHDEKAADDDQHRDEHAPADVTTTRPTRRTTSPGTGETAPSAPPTTAAPDTTPPALQISTGSDTIRERDASSFCPEPLGTETTLTAAASDPSGVASLRATWRTGGRDHSSDLTSGAVTFGSFAAGTVPGYDHEDVTITVVATDHAGNSSTATTTVRVLSAHCLG